MKRAREQKQLALTSPLGLSVKEEVQLAIFARKLSGMVWSVSRHSILLLTYWDLHSSNGEMTWTRHDLDEVRLEIQP